MSRDLHCTICCKPLTGGLDTWGYVGLEMCFDCELALSIASSEGDFEDGWGPVWRRLQTEEWLRMEADVSE